jgi:hypothetical protein
MCAPYFLLGIGSAAESLELSSSLEDPESESGALFSTLENSSDGSGDSEMLLGPSLSDTTSSLSFFPMVNEMLKIASEGYVPRCVLESSESGRDNRRYVWKEEFELICQF